MWTFRKRDLKYRLTLRVAAVAAFCFAAVSAYFLFDADRSVHERVGKIAGIAAKSLELQQDRVFWLADPRTRFPDLTDTATAVMAPGLCIAYRGNDGIIVQRFCGGAENNPRPPEAFAAFYGWLFDPGREATRPVNVRGAKVGEAVAWVDPGTLTAEAAIITLPSALLADETLSFDPPLPQKVDAAAGLPLGLADKLFLSLSDAHEFDRESRLFGRTDRRKTGVYHFRPLGRPQIEAYFGAALAAELEAAGEAAFAEFAVAELAGLLGNDFARRVKPLALHRWGSDPFARGSYSHALPGRAECRAVLAAAVDERLFFAGEACSAHDFSTAHGAYLTGVAAAEQAIAARRR